MRAICFDTETTGLLPEDEIIQLSIADAETDEEIYNAYFRPSDFLVERGWDGAAAVTGIYPDDVADCPSITDPEVFDEIQAIFDDADIVVGYHVAYDVKMMEHMGFDMSRYIYQDPMLSYAPYYWTHHPEETTYTHRNGATESVWLDYAPDGFGGYGRYCPRKLVAAAAELCGITDFGAHNSMNDVWATCAVWREMNEIQAECDERPVDIGARYIAGERIIDDNGQPCLIDDQGLAMIDPNGNAFRYVYDYTRDELLAADDVQYCSVG